MVKSNIREQAANQLNLFTLLIQRIIVGENVSVESAKKALKNMNEMITWLDRRDYKTNIRGRAINNLRWFAFLMQRTVSGKPVSVESGRKALKGIEEIMAWLDKRQYKTKN